MQSFKDRLREDILRTGSLTLGDFMARANAHYYATRDPLGTKGDFTTAPEISQIFGELIGVWIADIWHKLGAPPRLHVIECGPGRGTLMADALRATQKISDFQAAVHIHLLETSPVLRAKQKATLNAYQPQWHEQLTSLPLDAPWIVIGNEFLDALPIEQYRYQQGVWQQRCVDVEGDSFVFIDQLADLIEPQASLVIERAPERDAFWQDLCGAVKKQTGAALMIDYGYINGAGDSFQALKGHQFVDPLQDVGDADLTAHVDFGRLREIAHQTGIDIWGPVDQARFLNNLGLSVRRDMLIQSARPDQVASIISGADRLVNSNQMGRLFKVLAVSVGLKQSVEGFS